MKQINEDVFLILENKKNDTFQVFKEFDLSSQIIDCLAITNLGIFVIKTIEGNGSLAGRDDEEVWIATDYLNFDGGEVQYDNPFTENQKIILEIEEKLKDVNHGLPIINMIVLSDKLMSMGVITQAVKTQVRDLTYTFSKFSKVKIEKEMIARIAKRLSGKALDRELDKDIDKDLDEPLLIHEVEEVIEEIVEDAEFNQESEFLMESIPVDKIDEQLHETYNPQEILDSKYVANNKELTEKKLSKTSISQAPFDHEAYSLYKVHKEKVSTTEYQTLEELEMMKSMKVIALIAIGIFFTMIGGLFGMIISGALAKPLYNTKADTFQDWLLKSAGIAFFVGFLALMIINSIFI